MLGLAEQNPGFHLNSVSREFKHMDFLYLSPKGQVPDVYENYFQSDSMSSDAIKYDFDLINSKIRDAAERYVDGVSVSVGSDVFSKYDQNMVEAIQNFDAVICNTTAINPNVMFCAGVAESLGKPVLYVSHSGAMQPHAVNKNRTLLYSEETLENDFMKEFLIAVENIKEDPNQYKLLDKDTGTRPKVFVSYSHKDSGYLDRIIVHLKPLVKEDSIDLWVDAKVRAGDKWQEEIEEALKSSNVAILLISADFLASDFIVDNELPPILSKAEVKGTRILPVVVSPCRFHRDNRLSQFQAVNSPSNPLSFMSHGELEEVFDRISYDVENALR